MYMYVMDNYMAEDEEDRRCTMVKFVIYDIYEGKRDNKYKFERLFNQIKHLEEFFPDPLRSFTFDKLMLLPFEQAPFQLHLTELQTQVNILRMQNMTTLS